MCQSNVYRVAIFQTTYENKAWHFEFYKVHTSTSKPYAFRKTLTNFGRKLIMLIHFIQMGFIFRICTSCEMSEKHKLMNSQRAIQWSLSHKWWPEYDSYPLRQQNGTVIQQYLHSINVIFIQSEMMCVCVQSVRARTSHIHLSFSLTTNEQVLYFFCLHLHTWTSSGLVNHFYDGLRLHFNQLEKKCHQTNEKKKRNHFAVISFDPHTLYDFLPFILSLLSNILYKLTD